MAVAVAVAVASYLPTTLCIVKTSEAGDEDNNGNNRYYAHTCKQVDDHLIIRYSILLFLFSFSLIVSHYLHSCLSWSPAIVLVAASGVAAAEEESVLLLCE